MSEITNYFKIGLLAGIWTASLIIMTDVSDIKNSFESKNKAVEQVCNQE